MQTYLITIGTTWGRSSDFIDGLFNCFKSLGVGAPLPDEIKVNVFINCEPKDLIMNGLGFEWPLTSIKSEYTLKTEGARKLLAKFSQLQVDLEDVELDLGNYFEEQLPDEALED